MDSSIMKHIRQFVIVLTNHVIWSPTMSQRGETTVAYEGPSPSDLNSTACVECGSNIWMRQRALHCRVRHLSRL